MIVIFLIICREYGLNSTFGAYPLLRDPYETLMIEVRTSEIDGAAEGIFAVQDLEINTVVAFYNGTEAVPDEYDPETWETNNYKIFDPANMPNGTIDIPVWAQVTGFEFFLLKEMFIFSVYFSVLCHTSSQNKSQFLAKHSIFGV